MKQSAGILLYKQEKQGVLVFLTHPGGPFWAKKDAQAWSIPKGEFDDIEEPRAAAWREFKEETGMEVPAGEAVELGVFKVSSNKQAHVWAIEADVDPKHVKSNMFELEWPPKSGKSQEYPEIDKAAWYSLAVAQTKIMKGQRALLETLAAHLGTDLPTPQEESKAPSIKTANIAKEDDSQTTLF
jgi:predicted NUDIX family NTP pyrophosphohydrolase